jgi:hypothetical protein
MGAFETKVVPASAEENADDMITSERQKDGRIRVSVYGKLYTADWKVIAGRVVITSDIGDGSVALGGLASAPAAAATEKFTEMVKAAGQKDRPASGDRARFNVRDAITRY